MNVTTKLVRNANLESAMGTNMFGEMVEAVLGGIEFFVKATVLLGCLFLVALVVIAGLIIYINVGA